MPEYLHPSVRSRITDNSFVFQTAQGTTVLFQAGKAKKGPDNVLTRLTTTDEIEFIFGQPELAETGQALYNVYNWVRAGGEAYFLRVLPEDAKYANLMLSLGLDLNGTDKKVNPMLERVAASASEAAMRTVLGAAPEVSGTVTKYPLGIFYPYGRGKGYDGLGIRLNIKDTLDGTYEFRTYDFEITAKDTTGADVVVEGPYTVAFEPTARDRNRESMYYANVVNKYSKFMRVMDRKDLYDDIRTFINSDTAVNPLNLDIFFGVERVGSTAPIHAGVKFGTPLTAGLGSNQITVAEAANLKTVNRVSGGFDGTWTGANSEDSLLVRAYGGEIDPQVLDKKSYLFDVLLDACYAPAVKNAMSDLANTIREDCFAYLDCMFQANEQQTIDFRSGSVSMSHRQTAIFAQDATVFDQYNGENIKVTMPYFLAGKIPAIDDQFGIQYSHTGPRRGVISGFEAINFFPNEMWKESLYKKQINYVEKDPKRINFGTQLTSQTMNSALSNINNVRALLRMRREVEAMMDEYRDEFNDSITHEAMSYNLNNYLQKWVTNRTCKSISGAVYASDYDRQQKIARVKVELVFTGLIERVFIDFVVNR